LTFRGDMKNYLIVGLLTLAASGLYGEGQAHCYYYCDSGFFQFGEYINWKQIANGPMYSALPPSETDQPSNELSIIEECCEPVPYYYDKVSQEWYVYADWIYWKPIISDPMYWATKRLLITLGAYNDGELQYLDLVYDYASGFKAGLGYRFRERECLDIRPYQMEVEYTRLNSVVSKTSHAPGRLSNSITDSFFPVLPFLFSNSSSKLGIFTKSSAILKYDRLDYKLAWPIWWNTNVIFRLIGGATFAWFKNNWDSTIVTAQDQGAFADTSTTKLSWKWWGGGLLGGGDIYLSISRHFGFYANGDFGLLFGPMHETEKYHSSSASEFDYTKATYHFTSFQPVVNFGAGFDYKQWINCVMLHLAVGWDFTWWFDLNQFGKQINSINTPTPGIFFLDQSPSDLGYQGLTVRLGFEF
jgi:hypothetical protein